MEKQEKKLDKGYYIRELLYNYCHEDLETQLDIDNAVRAVSFRNIDLRLIDLMKQQYSCTEMTKHLVLGVDAVTYRQRRICQRLAGVLGEEYQDEHILSSSQFILKRELSDQEVDFVHFVLRRSRSKISKRRNIFNSA